VGESVLLRGVVGLVTGLVGALVSGVVGCGVGRDAIVGLADSGTETSGEG